MKVEYKILWIDDQIDDFEEEGCVDAISSHLEENGFTPNIIKSSKSKDFFDNLDDTFDLILTDFHMGAVTGEDIITQVREQSILTEILFYTAKADLKDTHKINRISFLQTSGDARGHHKTVEEETIKLIDLTIKKFQHIVAMRGMIMHETSTLDSQSLKIIKQFLDKDGCNYDELAASIFDKILANLDEKIKKATEYKEKMDFKKLTKDNVLFSADNKIEALSSIANTSNVTDFTEDYKNEVIAMRNKFAHAELLKDENGREYFKSGNDGLTFDENLCREIRKNINKHKKNLDDLLMSIK